MSMPRGRRSKKTLLSRERFADRRRLLHRCCTRLRSRHRKISKRRKMCGRYSSHGPLMMQMILFSIKKTHQWPQVAEEVSKQERIFSCFPPLLCEIDRLSLPKKFAILLVLYKCNKDGYRLFRQEWIAIIGYLNIVLNIQTTPTGIGGILRFISTKTPSVVVVLIDVVLKKRHLAFALSKGIIRIMQTIH